MENKFCVIKYFDDYVDGVVGTFDTPEEAHRFKVELEHDYRNMPYTTFEVRHEKTDFE